MNLFNRRIECTTGIRKQAAAALFISGCYVSEPVVPPPVSQFEKLEETVTEIDQFGNAVLDISDQDQKTYKQRQICSREHIRLCFISHAVKRSESPGSRCRTFSCRTVLTRCQ